MLEKFFLLGVGITNAKEDEVLEYILQGLKKSGENYYIVTPNPEILVFANKHKGFKAILNNARLALCDGIGVFWAGKLLGKSIKQRVTGVDLLESLCRAVSQQPITVGFLGGGEKIAERAAECLVKKYPGLTVAFFGEEWGEEGFVSASRLELRSKNQELRAKNHNSLFMIHNSIDVLFVAFGFPKQEEWMAKNIDKVPVRIMVGVGGSFDYISGAVKRAPLLIRLIGFEWFYRLIAQPWRWRRQLTLLEFVLLVLKEKFIKSQKKNL